MTEVGRSDELGRIRRIRHIGEYRFSRCGEQRHLKMHHQMIDERLHLSQGLLFVIQGATALLP